MGLIERRMIEELKTTTLPAREAEIAEICGTRIPYDVDWDSLASDAEALRFVDNVSCHRLNMALRTICTDALGRQAVSEGLKRVRLVNVAEPADMAMRFEGGVLEMRCAYRHGAMGMHRDSDIRQLLEQGL